MKSEAVKQLIRESIEQYIREIDNAGNKAAVTAKIEACKEAIGTRTKKIEMSESLEEMKDMINPERIKDLKKEIKVLERSLKKYEKQLAKLDGKGSDSPDKEESPEGEKKEVVTEEEPTVEANIDLEEIEEEEAIKENEEMDEDPNNEHEELAIQMKADGAGYDEIVEKLLDKGCDSMAAQSIAEKVLRVKDDSSFEEPEELNESNKRMMKLAGLKVIKG